ncbi:apolipoprotein N-acyltransferase [Paracrocinitomix mangrovi]|uniref:apolipoprotein N-acyltransferase n=1 Tax=Paracrocinitomix mangrovi TaxID=2862509 RepID=UPI001C8F0E47|nr:apolipoprotein N-acyltransferase [Paracrocinitomix mangrovi]UKN03266.1 apolipoprotein N-acyltransferase [Paracrocinitomix mangrovi]
MKLKIIHLLILSILSGLMLGVGFPFTGGVFPLMFIAFVPLLIINHQLNENKRKGRILIRFGLNYLTFLIFNAITVWWIYYASEEGMYMAVFANALLMAFVMGLFGFLSRQLEDNRGLFSFFVLWLGFEHVHYYWELSWPWLNIGHVFGTSPKLIQWYEYSGVAGGSMWILIVNIVVYIIIRNVFFKKESLKIQTPNILFLGLSIVIPIVSSLIIYYNYEEEENPVNIVIVQPNVEAHTEKFYTPVETQLAKMFSAAESAINDQTDIVVLPETAIPWSKNEENLEFHPHILAVKEFIKTHGDIPWIIGADTYKLFEGERGIACRDLGNGNCQENYNTALLVQSDMPLQIYHKSELVLGGEKLPFLDMFPFLAEYSVELGGTSGLLGIGEEPINFEAKGVDFAPLICYESVYGDLTSRFVRKGAGIICVITNDGWWRDTPGYKQHRMFSQIRAIENRRSVARSANTGISCFIDQRGEIISELGWNEYGTLSESINKNEEFTFFTKYESVIGRLSSFLSIAMVLFGLMTRLKKVEFVDKYFTRK